MTILAALNRTTMDLRKTRSPLSGAFQAVLASATAQAKERVRVTGGDFSNVEVTDEDALRAVQKAIKQVRDTLALKPDHEASLQELEILEGLLPQMASEDDIRTSAEEFAATLPEKSMKQMGATMAHLSQVFGTALDKAKASAIVKSVLAA